MSTPEPRVSFQMASMRPSGATDMVPNHCQWPGSAASSLTRTGVLHVSPLFSLRQKCTSIGSGPGGSMEVNR
ncbi:MAG: hypothetical protein ACYTBR_16185 [Planctomycetota bacterium]